jgi:arginyl-tRNA synthetase
MIKQQLQQLIFQTVERLYQLSDFSVDLEHPNDITHGDFSSNIAMKLAKSLGKNPQEVAQEIVNSLSHEKQLSEIVASTEIAGPGFINFHLSPALLLKEAKTILEQNDDYGRLTIGQDQKALVEYAQMNVAKPMHVGHLRTTILGDSLKRLYQWSGYETVSDTHWGDWGTQFGMVLLAYKQEEAEEAVKADPVGELVRLYISMNKQVEDNPDLREAAKAEFKKLEDGDEENTKLWQWFVDASIGEFHKVFEIIGILPFEYELGESDYNNKMQSEVDLALKQDATKQEGQLVYVDLEEQKLGRCILVKSDGATTYHLRDMATLRERIDEFKADKILYVVDSRQSHHFKQLFEVARLVEMPVEGVEHISYGFVTLPEGSLSTRKGRIVEAKEVLNQGIEQAKKVIEEKNPDLKNKNEVALAVARSAIKFANLLANRNTDIVFDWKQVLRFDGDTGPYLQYTYARIQSLLKKAGDTEPRIDLDFADIEPSEKDLLRTLYLFSEQVELSLEQNDPHFIAHYLLSVAHAFNSVYNDVLIATEPNDQKRAFRLALSKATSHILKNGLGLLGINVVEEM